MKKLITILLIYISLFFNCAFADEEEGERIEADVTLFILDASPSMASSHNSSINKIYTYFDFALDTIRKLMDNYTSSDEIGFRSTKRESPKQNSCNSTTLHVPIEKGSKSRIKQITNTLRSGRAGSNIEYNLKQAIEVDFANYSESTMKRIILITDAYEGCGGNSCDYIRELTKTRNDIIIDVISVSGNDSLYNCLTKPTGGQVYNHKNIDKISNFIFKPKCEKCAEYTEPIAKVESITYDFIEEEPTVEPINNKIEVKQPKIEPIKEEKKKPEVKFKTFLLEFK